MGAPNALQSMSGCPRVPPRPGIGLQGKPNRCQSDRGDRSGQSDMLSRRDTEDHQGGHEVGDVDERGAESREEGMGAAASAVH